MYRVFFRPALSLTSFIPCLLTDSCGSFFWRSPPRANCGGHRRRARMTRRSSTRAAAAASPAAASRLRAATRPSSWSSCRLRSSFASASSGSSVQANQASSISNSLEIRRVRLPDAVHMVLMLVRDDHEIEASPGRCLDVVDHVLDRSSADSPGRSIPACSRSRSARRPARRPCRERRAGNSRRAPGGTCAR